MISYAFSYATTFFYLPIDEDEDKDLEDWAQRGKYLTWNDVATPLKSDDFPCARGPLDSKAAATPRTDTQTVDLVLSFKDLYLILGLASGSSPDATTLRRAYLNRSKECHPDKFPASSHTQARATLAFQKLALAYDILRDPASKRQYDAHPPPTSSETSPEEDIFARHSMGAAAAEETFRSVLVGLMNDFLDGDLEIVRGVLKSIANYNPSLALGEEAIDSLLASLESIRNRALVCRLTLYALHSSLLHLFEIQSTMRQLSYFDLFGRTRLGIKLARGVLMLPIVVEDALASSDILRQYPDQEPFQNDPPDSGEGSSEKPQPKILPRHVVFLIRGVDGALGKMEQLCGPGS